MAYLIVRPSSLKHPLSSSLSQVVAVLDAGFAFWYSNTVTIRFAAPALSTMTGDCWRKFFAVAVWSRSFFSSASVRSEVRPAAPFGSIVALAALGASAASAVVSAFAKVILLVVIAAVAAVAEVAVITKVAVVAVVAAVAVVL